MDLLKIYTEIAKRDRYPVHSFCSLTKHKINKKEVICLWDFSASKGGQFLSQWKIDGKTYSKEYLENFIKPLNLDGSKLKTCTGLFFFDYKKLKSILSPFKTPYRRPCFYLNLGLMLISENY